MASVQPRAYWTPLRPAGPVPRPNFPGRVIPGPWRPPLRPYTPIRPPFGLRVPPAPPVGWRLPGLSLAGLRAAGWMGLGFQVGWWLGDVFPWTKPISERFPAGYTWSYDCPGWSPPYPPPVSLTGHRGSPTSAPPGPIYYCLEGQVPQVDPPYPANWGFGYLAIVGPMTDDPSIPQRMIFDEMVWYPSSALPPADWADRWPKKVPGVALPLPDLQIPPWLDPNYLPILKPVPPLLPPLRALPPATTRPMGDPDPWQLPDLAPPPYAPPSYFPRPAQYPDMPYIPAPEEVPIKGRPPVTRPQEVPAINIPLNPGPIYQPSPRPRPQPGGQPGAGPEPGANPKPSPYPVPEWGIHGKNPPNARTRERKTRSAGLGGLLWRLVGNVTETYDAISAVYKALPWQLRRFKGRDGKWRDKAVTPQDRARAIWDFAGKASQSEWDAFMFQAAKNVAWEQVQDYAIGKLASGRVKAYKRNEAAGYEPGKPTGIGISTGGAIGS